MGLLLSTLLFPNNTVKKIQLMEGSWEEVKESKADGLFVYLTKQIVLYFASPVVEISIEDQTVAINRKQWLTNQSLIIDLNDPGKSVLSLVNPQCINLITICCHHVNVRCASLIDCRYQYACDCALFDYDLFENLLSGNRHKKLTMMLLP